MYFALNIERSINFIEWIWKKKKNYYLMKKIILQYVCC